MSADLFVVHKLLAILHDRSLTDDQKIEAVANDPEATAEDRMQAAQWLAAEAADTINLVISHGTVLDLRLNQLQILAAAYGEVARTDVIYRKPDLALSNALKVIPADEAKNVIEC